MTEKNLWKKEIKDIFKTKSKEEETEEAERQMGTQGSAKNEEKI